MTEKKTYFVSVQLDGTATIQIDATSAQEAVDIAKSCELSCWWTGKALYGLDHKGFDILDQDYWIENCTTVEEEGQGDELWVEDWRVEEVSQ